MLWFVTTALLAPSRSRQVGTSIKVATGSVPTVELWLDLRATIKEPMTTLKELYADVAPQLESAPSGPIAGVVMWRDPSAEPPDVGGLPVIAIEPEPGVDISMLPAAPESSPGVDVRVVPEPFDVDVAAVEPGACVILENPEESDAERVRVLAGAAFARFRLLVAFYEVGRLAIFVEALVLGGLGGSESLLLGSQEEETTAAGLGVVLPPYVNLWAYALTYNFLSYMPRVSRRERKSKGGGSARSGRLRAQRRARRRPRCRWERAQKRRRQSDEWQTC